MSIMHERSRIFGWLSMNYRGEVPLESYHRPTGCRSLIDGMVKSPPVNYSYNELIPELYTGDLVLFVTKKSFFSKLINKFTGPVAHIGIVYRDKETAKLYLFESANGNTSEDVNSGKVENGVTMVDLELRIKSEYDKYKTSFFIRKFNFVNHVNYERMEDSIEDLRVAYEMLPYESNWWTFFKLGVRNVLKFFKFKGDDSSLFCSELVAEVLQLAKAVPVTLIPDSFTPTDFMDRIDLCIDNSSYYSELLHLSM